MFEFSDAGRTGAFGVESPIEGSSAEEQVEAVFSEFGDQEPPVVIMVAHEDDLPTMKPAEKEFDRRGIEYHTILVPNPSFAMRFAETAALRGVRVIISGSAWNAPLTTLLALHTDVPVIGVPLSRGSLNGYEALMSTAQTTPGSPVACMAIDGAHNAAVFATHILNAIPLAPR